ncbi:MAG: ParB/RepB/Spo0J family partition protein [Oscillospiraceae bacterium]|nr:ParB/RepB/Spo0J family partition protein [Oscillospiraceae bacterium]
MSPRGGLGTGLGAILGESAIMEEQQPQQTDFVYLPISKVEANALQPRKYFDEISLAELAESIREHGVLQPLTVRKLDTGYYQIIGGERRWRAARLAGLAELPCRVIEADDRLATELALIENLQREDLNPLEEAEGYKVLIEEFGLTQEEAAQRVGKSRPAVANAMRLLGLCKEVKEFLEQGVLSAGHARALLKLKNQDHQLALAQKVIQEGLSVRQAERQADRADQEKKPVPVKAKPFVDYTQEVETRLTRSLGRKVKIVAGRKRGRLEIDYYNPDDLEIVIKALDSLNLAKGR